LDCYVLALDSTDSLTLYVGTASNGVYRSTDAGSSWAPANTGLPPNAFVDALAIDPTYPQTIYGATWGHGVYKSTNGGEEWSPLNDGLEGDLYIYGLALDPTDTDTQTLYAATHQQGVYRFKDGSWYQDGLAGKIAYTVIVDAEGVAYAGTDGTGDGQAVYQRPKSGSWEPMAEQPGTLKVRSLVPCDPVLLAGTTDGAWWYGPD